VKKKAILISLMFGFAVAALLCVMCNDNGAGDDNKGYANEFVSKFNKPDMSSPETMYTLKMIADPPEWGSVFRDPDSENDKYAANVNVNVRAEAKEGYSFVGWDGDDVSNNVSDQVTITMDRNKNLTAKFVPKPDSTYELKVKAEPAKGGVVKRDPAGPIYKLNDSVTVTANASLGYTFSGWSGASTSKETQVVITINGDTTLTAEFNPITYEIKYVLNGGELAEGETNPTYYTIETTSFKLINPTKENHKFTGWTGTNGNDTDTNVTIKQGTTGHLSYIANFKESNVVSPPDHDYMVTLENVGNYATGGGEYKQGATVSIYAGTAPTGKQFKNWTTSDGVTFEDSTKVETTFTMPANAVTVTAVFELIPNTFIDTRDSTVYWIVKIGNQTWMAENLNYTMVDSSWCLQDMSTKCVDYGRLYNWEAAVNACPKGWHLPDREDWGVLAKFAGGTGNYGDQGDAGEKLKSKSGWLTDAFTDCSGSEDKYGFSALPGGRRVVDGSFNSVVDGFWWSKTTLGDDSSKAYGRSIRCNDRTQIEENINSKAYGLSVRCVQDTAKSVSKKRISK